jgi:hypothetical protein
VDATVATKAAMQTTGKRGMEVMAAAFSFLWAKSVA